MLRAYLLAFAAPDTIGGSAAVFGMNVFIVIIGVPVVELDLDDLDLRIFDQYTIQHLCFVMEGYSEMLDLSLFFLIPKPFVFFKDIRVLRVH